MLSPYAQAWLHFQCALSHSAKVVEALWLVWPGRLVMIGLLAAVIWLLAGCKTTQRDTPRVIVTPTGEATATQIATLQAENAELKTKAETQAQLAENAAGAVYGASHANTSNPDGLPKEAVATHLEEAASALPEVTPEKKLERERENARILAGELAAVKAEKGQAISENLALKAKVAESDRRIAELDAKLVEVTKQAERERAEAAAKLQRQFDEMSARIAAEKQRAQEAVDEAKKAALQRLGLVLLGLGALFVLVGAFQAYATVQAGDLTPKGFLKPLVWAGAAAFCFACYWTINQPWFKWLVIGGGCAGVLAGGLFFYAEWNEAKQRRAGKERASEADEAEGTLMKIIATADALPESTTLAEYKASLARAMNDTNKALVHELRAEAKRLSTIKPTS